MDRITNAALSDRVLANNQRTLKRMATFQEQLASGKRINRVSDDPVSAKIALRYRSEDLQAAKYLDNIDKSTAFITATDATLGEMAQTFDQVKALAVQGSNGSQDASSRKALAAAVQSHLERMVDLANTVHDGRYIFAGTAVQQRPFDLSANAKAVTYQGNLDTFEVAVSPGSTAVVNDNGFALFQGGDSDVFKTLIDLRDALNTNDTAAIVAAMGKVDSGQTHLNNLNGALGGRMQRLDVTRSQIENSRTYISDLISKAEDADMPAVISNLQLTQTALQAGLQSGARVVQQTLLDFLR